MAVSHGARIVKSKKSRGSQLAAGANIANGDWFLFLHADTQLGLGWKTIVTRYVNSPKNYFKAAYFIFGLDDPSSKARCLEKWVKWRCKLFSLPFGDQGLLVNRQFYNLLGGFSSIPLMEDVDLVTRIRSSRLKQLPIIATTSAKKYRKEGYLLRSLRNFFCLVLYFTGVSPTGLLKLYND